MASDPAPPPAAARRPLAELFPAGDFRHRLRLARGEPADFFAPWTAREASAALLAERRHWLASAPEHHAPFLPAAEPAVREAARLATGWGAASLPLGADARSLWLAIGGALEPDLVLLARIPGAARPVMVAGAVCFPSSWAPEVKLGRDLRDIHAVVPELNAELGPPIEAAIERLRPGTAWFRGNWGLSASSERNQHPDRGLPRLALPLDPASVRLRIEHQALLTMPETGAVLFGIRIEQLPLAVVRRDPSLASGLARALRSMPDSLARYKGLAAAREEIARFLDEPSPPPPSDSD